MTYTRAWVTGSPAGIRPGSQFHTSQNELRTDLHERLQDVVAQFGGTWTNDPVVSATLTKYMYLHWSAFLPYTNEYSALFGGNVYGVGAAGQYAQTLVNNGIGFCDGSGAARTVTIYAPITIPDGATLVDVDVSCYVNGVNESVAGTVYVLDCVDPVNPARTQLATRTLGNPTTQGNYSVSSGAGINHALDRAKKEFLFLAVAVTTDSNGAPATQAFQGARITYTRHPLGYA